MKKLIIVITLIILMLGFKTFYELEKDNNNILGKKISISPSSTTSPTPTEVPTPEITPSPTPVPTEKPTITPSPVPLPTFTSQQIYEYIEKFAGVYGVSADILRHIAICESGFNHLAKNSGYGGLYQFGVSTWKNIRISMGEYTDANLRFNAEEAVQTAAYVLKENKAYIWPNCIP